MVYYMILEISSRILENFETKDTARERSLKLSRKMVRISGRAIKSIHRGEWDIAEKLLDEVSTLNREIISELEDHPDIFHAGFVENAQQEYAEASILYSIMKKDRVPDPAKLSVKDPAYLLGLGDVVGELRRVILDLIRLDRPHEGEELLEIMDEIYSTIMLFDFPDALSRGLRRKGDVARSLVERTRGDITNAMEHAKLKERMSELEKKL